ncbi:MAG TPA: DUF308 domain-containing protein [Candidatus Scatomonas pullistercoris]|uniref:DUF308 domain-containing protein n=1 Tax=Candidatus Scatomonas pullistercoris TaxID=2840920 RepID=A0A9D1T9F4_9FIRM|nr:DUF308 domain-containing protein [Candidatus Scatomonas pullistercoris]
MKDFLERTKLMTELVAVLMIVLGILLLVNPGEAVLLVCRLSGVILGITGLVLLLMSLNNRQGVERGNGLDIFLTVLGIILLALGLFIVFRPGVVVGFAGVLFAVVLFVHGIGDLREMITLKQMGYSRWWVSLLCAAVTFLMGLVVLLLPFDSAALMMRIAGIFLVLDGISELYLALRVVSLKKRYNTDRMIEGHAREIDDEHR